MTQRIPLHGQRIKKVKRRIQFYRAHVGTFDSGTLVPVDPAEWQMETNRLGYGEEAPSRYMSIADDDLLWIRWRKSSGYPAMQFCRTRKSALPQKERKGRVSELGIRPDEGLVEQMHIVFFPDNLVGSEYNHFGPKMSQLAPYLKAKMETHLFDSTLSSVETSLRLPKDYSIFVFWNLTLIGLWSNGSEVLTIRLQEPSRRT